MARGGRLLLIEQIVPPDGTGSFTHVADLNMLVLLGGRERTAAEYHCLLEQAGLRCTAQQPIPGDRRGWTLTTATAV